MKREDYINWDEYFMGIALLTAMRSKDPNSQDPFSGLQRDAHGLQR